MVELQYMMAMNAYLMRSDAGPLTNAFLDWICPIARNYHGPAASPELADFIVQLRNLSEQEREAVFKARYKANRGLYPKQQCLPFVTAHFGELSVFPLQFQAAILRVKGQLELFNQHVAFVQKRHDMTFTVTKEQYERVANDFRDGIAQLAYMAEQIATAISDQAILKGR